MKDQSLARVRRRLRDVAKPSVLNSQLLLELTAKVPEAGHVFVDSEFFAIARYGKADLVDGEEISLKGVDALYLSPRD